MNRSKRLVNLFKGALDLVDISDIALPCLDLDIVLFSKSLGDLVCVLGRVEDDGDVGVGLGKSLGDGESDT